MPELLGATNPVPGYDNAATNRNIPISPNNTQVQNVPDPGKVVRPDGRTEQQDNGNLTEGGQIRYDSNFQTFIQRLRETGALAGGLGRLLSLREGVTVLSGLSQGIAEELSQAVEMLKMDPAQLLKFFTGQVQSGTKFGGALFALLRGAYDKAASEGVRQDILAFLKSYSDYSSTAHIEKNLMRNLSGMADAMPKTWAEPLRDIAARLENAIAAGDREGALQLLRQEALPHMSNYVSQTHDLGTARSLLSLLTLDMTRYENGSGDNLLHVFHRLKSYGTLREQLGGMDDQALLTLLQQEEQNVSPEAAKFANHLSSAASLALRGEGSAETQQIFQQLVAAMLINESVYMPVNHYLIPIEMNGRTLFSELWVDPDDQDSSASPGGKVKRGVRMLFKIDVQSLGLFDVILTSREQEVSVHIACPEAAALFSQQMEQAVSGILLQNGLSPAQINVSKMERPVTLTEVFPKIFEGKNCINVKV